MSDFDGELSIEPVRGVRVFQIDGLGRLCGVTHNDVWRPGENVSRCLAPPQTRLDFDERAYRLATQQWSQEREAWAVQRASLTSLTGRLKREQCGSEPVEPKPEDFVRAIGEPPKHDRATCQCGFWAFYEPNDQYDGGRGGRVYGVIEGYGEITIGSKGFRAEKARILALSLPGLLDGGSEMAAYLQSLVRRNYPDVPAFDSLPKMLAEVPASREPKGPESEGFWDQRAPERDTGPCGCRSWTAG